MFREKSQLFLLLFWIEHPALFYGIAFCLGIYAHFFSILSLLFPFFLLLFPFLDLSFQKWKPLFLAILLFFSGAFYAQKTYPFLHLSSGQINGMARVQIKEVQYRQTFFTQEYIYSCLIKELIVKDTAEVLRNIPCTLHFPIAKERPKADREYWVSGVLKNGKFKQERKSDWEPIPHSFSFSELRWKWKQQWTEWMKKKIKNPLSHAFLAGICTGQFSDYSIREEFSRFGLQHLLAISGFHFSVLASFLGVILRLFCSIRTGTLVLIFLLGGYAFFLGDQPSIMRAWLMSSLGLSGLLFNKQSTPLNNLGIALVTSLTYDPLFCVSIGFQLSFIATAAILLFSSFSQNILDQIFQKRKLKDVLEMSHAHQWVYCVLSFLREGLSLTVATNLLTFPLVLFYFSYFPLMGLFYNLFFPLLASLSIFFLLLALLTSFVPFLSDFIHASNNLYTSFLLDLTYNVPQGVDVAITTHPFTIFWIIIYLSSIVFLGIIGYVYFSQRIVNLKESLIDV